MKQNNVRPFEKALIQVILEQYGDIVSAFKQTSNPKFRELNGATNNVEEDSEYPSNAELDAVSLWINVDSKDIYLSPISGTIQYVFMNNASRSACMNLLLEHGFSLHNP